MPSCRAPPVCLLVARFGVTRPAGAGSGAASPSGAVRVSSVSLSGKQISLAYVEPGTWFGDIALFDGLPRRTMPTPTAKPPDGRAQARLQGPADAHVELYDALLRLNCRRLRLMFDPIEDLNTRPLAARLARQLLLLAESYGVAEGEEIRIGLALAQEDLAQLLGASRQRVNQELKGFEREGAAAGRTDAPGGPVARKAAALADPFRAR